MSYARLLPVAVFFLAGAPAVADDEKPARIPVILVTDIGDDIDDTWALIMLLKSPELDLTMVATTFGKAEYRVKLVARILSIAGRADIPIGMGAGGRNGEGQQQAWVKDYDLASYAGKIHEDGVQAMIDAINASAQPITLISIGPSNTIADALKRQPAIASKAIFVGMQGSVRRGYNGGNVCAEWNVKANVAAAQTVLLAPWKQCLITPLDTCGVVRLTGDRFKALRGIQNVLVGALMENCRLWANKPGLEELQESSVLFDTVAVYLAVPGPRALVGMEDLNIIVTEDGFTKIDPSGVRMFVATEWKNLDGFSDELAAILAR